jgi:hypothetical protein
MSRDKTSGRPTDGEACRSRRGVIAAAAGAAGVVAAETLARATPAQAANGDPVLQGTDNGPATRRTEVFTTSSSEFASLADPNTSGKGSLGVYGHGQDVGVFGDSAAGTGIGVQGVGGPSGGTGVLGNGGSGAGAGVRGVGGDGGGPGGQFTGTGESIGLDVAGGGSKDGLFALGGPDGGIGVVGAGGGIDGDGVHGIAASSNNVGVVGIGVGGTGVQGSSSGSGFGVAGGAEPGGVGVFAVNAGNGTALQVSGKAAFSRSGHLTVGAGSSKVTKTSIDLTAASLVFATLQQHRDGVSVSAAVPDVAGSSFTIHLTKAVTASTKVAWFVLN